MPRGSQSQAPLSLERAGVLPRAHPRVDGGASWCPPAPRLRAVSPHDARDRERCHRADAQARARTAARPAQVEASDPRRLDRLGETEAPSLPSGRANLQRQRDATGSPRTRRSRISPTAATSAARDETHARDDLRASAMPLGSLLLPPSEGRVPGGARKVRGPPRGIGPRSPISWPNGPRKAANLAYNQRAKQVANSLLFRTIWPLFRGI
jgi:hypothetical protein